MTGKSSTRKLNEEAAQSSQHYSTVESKTKKDQQSWFSQYKCYILAYSIAAFSMIYPYVYNNYILVKSYHDCAEYFRNGQRVDGIYEIHPTNDPDVKLDVYCNMTAGGWTMIMRRRANSPYQIDFQVPLEHYKFGFGDLNADHFIGLDNIYALTRNDNRQLMLIINNTQFKYNRFMIADEFYHYKFIIAQEIDKFSDGASLLRLNNTLFSALDVDYDLAPNSNCSSGWNAGWWFTNCFDHSVCATCLVSHGNEGIKKLSYAAMLIK